MTNDQVPESSDALKRVTMLANLIIEKQKQIAAREAEQKLDVEALKKLEQTDLPELMRELTLTEITLEDGSGVKVLDDIQCGITEERRPAAHAWLEENGFGGLIKTALSILYGRDERERCREDAARITELLGCEVISSESVHPATLKSFLKERREAGDSPPEELFGIFPFVRAKITPPAKPKAKKYAPKGANF